MQLWSMSSCELFGGDRFAKYDGDPMTAIRMSGPILYSNHVLRHLLAGSDARVITLGNYVGEPVVNRNFNVDVGILRWEFAQGRQ